MSANIKLARDVCECFEALFADKNVIPFELEIQWLKMAIAEYGVELEPIEFDNETYVFNPPITQNVANVLAQMMNVYYQERETSRVNKRVSIVTKDISIDGTNGAKTAAKAELDYKTQKLEYMINDLKPTAYN